MNTVIELVQYKLRPDVSEEDFLNTLKPVLENFLKKQTGFLRPWEIYKSEDGVWTEIVRWKTMEDAKQAADPKLHGPCQDFFGFMDKSTIKTQYTIERKKFD